jgi:carbamoyltransferase
MYILGISCFYHDSAAALLQDGVLIAAAEEERFSRKKHDFGFPENAIKFCLDKARIKAEELDYVVFYEKSMQKFERLLTSILDTFPHSLKVFRESMITWLGEKLFIKNLIKEKVCVTDKKIIFVEHHLSHAASALFCSPYKEAAILTADGVGEWTTTTLGYGKANWNGTGENQINLFAELRFPHSLGLLYSAFTAFLGFEVNEGEYKVMGMAPYGEPKYVDQVWKLLDLKDDGSFWLDTSYFSYFYHPEKTFNGKFERLFGSPRNPKTRFVTSRTSLYDDPYPPTAEELQQNQYYADIAASIQKVTEEVLLKMAQYLHRHTGLKKLCLAGGVALNSVSNYRLLKETPFEELYIQPAAGDAGGAIGAALYAYHVLLGQPRKFVLEHAYWGEEYREEDIHSFLEENGLRYEYFSDSEQLLERVVEALTAGKIVGWYQGRFEWGPRALGNRSILADPRQAIMKDIVNIKIKFREPFRPFAPSVLAERAGEYFVLPDSEGLYPARFMLMVMPVRPDKQTIIPAVTHVDGTGRLQMVYRDTNPRYYRFIEIFGQATGVPVILNTSFNLKGEPIVNTPANAYHTFQKSEMDILVLENFLLERD